LHSALNLLRGITNIELLRETNLGSWLVKNDVYQ